MLHAYVFFGKPYGIIYGIFSGIILEIIYEIILEIIYGIIWKKFLEIIREINPEKNQKEGGAGFRLSPPSRRGRRGVNGGAMTRRPECG